MPADDDDNVVSHNTKAGFNRTFSALFSALCVRSIDEHDFLPVDFEGGKGNAKKDVRGTSATHEFNGLFEIFSSFLPSSSFTDISEFLAYLTPVLKSMGIVRHQTSLGMVFFTATINNSDGTASTKEQFKLASHTGWKAPYHNGRFRDPALDLETITLKFAIFIDALEAGASDEEREMSPTLDTFVSKLTIIHKSFTPTPKPLPTPKPRPEKRALEERRSGEDNDADSGSFRTRGVHTKRTCYDATPTSQLPNAISRLGSVPTASATFMATAMSYVSKKIGIVELNRDILGGVNGARQAQQLFESVRALQAVQAVMMASASAVPAAAGAGAAATATPDTENTVALDAL